jgi:hypothetical protein
MYKKTLTFIFNESINKGVFPDLLKIAKMRPVCKKGNRQEISNYRPISVISIFSQIFEKIVYKGMVSVIINKSLTENQYGSQKNKLTISACQSFIGNAQEALDSHFAVGMYSLISQKHMTLLIHSFIYLHSIRSLQGRRDNQ